ncbi:helix-turn-helix transcriptional regulator [Desulfoplanes formicivorans]|uniref:XRE family transcriptional regulator n=1 Tax=Desulfoplanes formicivorans TaxID=1592317 RepID=A0A194ABU6_9BACT|nr:helix-turn-helix transcriptional regulator [Desulfoplanes formicivorans]GAU07627.1 XRE family transcriptional regulator [Desulfoplanes formicivorans]
MRKQISRTYSRSTREAGQLLGNLIRLGRKERRMTQAELAQRAGISVGTLRKIEQGDLKCEIGLVFEAAVLVGVKLFEVDPIPMGLLTERVEDKLALLPKRIDKHDAEAKDDF